MTHENGGGPPPSDGLAPRLTTPWLDSLSPSEIASRLEGSTFRLAQVSGGATRGRRRPRPFRALHEWSWDMLSGPETALCRRLSVFTDGFTFEAATAVGQGGDVRADDVADLLDGLERRRLVVVDGHPVGTRLRLPETVRQLAREQLNASREHDSVASRHAGHYVAAVVEAGDPRQGSAWVERLAPDHANVEAALRWAAAAGQTAAALRLAGAHVLLCRNAARHEEARAWLSRLLVQSEKAPGTFRAAALCDAGLVAGLVGDFEAARVRLRRSAAVAAAADDASGAARAQNRLGFVCMLACDYERGVRALDEGVAMTRRSGDAKVLSEALAAAGRAHLLVGDPAAGRRHFAEAVEVAGDSGDEVGTANGLIGLGWAAVLLGDYEEAAGLLDDGLARAQEVADVNAVSAALAWQGEVARRRGDEIEAGSCFEEAAALAWEAGRAHPLGRALLGLGRVALDRGDLTAAQRRFDDALAVARQGNLPQLVAPCLTGLGQVAAASGEHFAARDFLEEAVSVAEACGTRAEEELARAALTALEPGERAPAPTSTAPGGGP